MKGRSRRWIIAVTTAVAGVALAAVMPASAAPPANDSFATAHAIAGESGSVDGTNVDATKEPGEPDHADDDGGRSVWYRWTAPTSDTYFFDTCGSGIDTLLAVYTGTAVSALTELAADDDTCGEQSVVFFAATAGTAYSIAVDGFGDDPPAAGPFRLRWRSQRPPANDDFAAAQALTGASGMVEGSNLGAQAESGEPRFAGSVGLSVWFTWTAPFSGTAVFETCGSSFDTVLGAFTGATVSTLTPVASNDDRCGLQSRIRFAAAGGTVYRIAVDSADRSSTGLISLSWSLATRPANDNVAAARRIGGPRGSVRATNAGALAEPGEPAHAGFTANASVWFRWRAPRTMGVRFDTCASTFDTVLAVYRERRPRRANLVDANDDACGRAGSRLHFLARRGVDYLIVVDGLFASTGAFTLAWGGPAAAARCVVPDVRGLTLARARAAIEREDCRVGRIVFTRSALVPRGRVVSQSPPAGRRVRFLARVSLEISR